MAELLPLLLAWIVANSPLPATTAPVVELVSHAQLCERASCYHVAYYDPRTETIHILDTLDMNDAADRSFMVHELVHHLQHRADRRYRCRGDREREAYDLQFAYLAANGSVDPLHDSGVGRVGYVVATQCRPHL